MTSEPSYGAAERGWFPPPRTSQRGAGVKEHKKVPGINRLGGPGLRGLGETQKSLCKSKLLRDKDWGRPSPTDRKLLES